MRMVSASRRSPSSHYAAIYATAAPTAGQRGVCVCGGGGDAPARVCCFDLVECQAVMHVRGRAGTCAALHMQRCSLMSPPSSSSSSSSSFSRFHNSAHRRRCALSQTMARHPCRRRTCCCVQRRDVAIAVPLFAIDAPPACCLRLQRLWQHGTAGKPQQTLLLIAMRPPRSALRS